MHQYYSTKWSIVSIFSLGSRSSISFLGSAYPVSRPKNDCNQNATNLKCIFSFFSRYWRKICGLLLSSFARAQRFWLHSNHRLRNVWSCQIGTESSIPLGCKMQPDQRCRSQANSSTLLQTQIPQCARLRVGQRRRHRDVGSLLFQTEIIRHWKVWRHRSRTEDALGALSELEETECEKLWHGQWRGNPKCCLLLPRTSAAQHSRLSGHHRRLPNSQEVLQTLHHWTFPPGILLKTKLIFLSKNEEVSRHVYLVCCSHTNKHLQMKNSEII